MLHALGSDVAPALAGVAVQGFDTIAEMLVAFGGILDQRCDRATAIVGHNIRFDLAKLRCAFVRNGIRIPDELTLREQPVCCTMDLFCRRFSSSNARMVSLADACESLGIAHHKDVVSGSEVGDLIESSEIDSLCRYSALDVLLEGKLFTVMTGHAAEDST